MSIILLIPIKESPQVFLACLSTCFGTFQKRRSPEKEDYEEYHHRGLTQIICQENVKILLCDFSKSLL